jgi:hypothetical protein
LGVHKKKAGEPARPPLFFGRLPLLKILGILKGIIPLSRRRPSSAFFFLFSSQNRIALHHDQHIAFA